MVLSTNVWLSLGMNEAISPPLPREPLLSVSDLRGQASTAPRLYNVQKLPANFLIDREGTIVAKDIYGKSLERKLDELTK